jgi:hypothetical protein
LHVLGFKNSKVLQVEDPNENRYHINQSGIVKSLKPELKYFLKDNKIHVSIRGNKKSSLRILEKMENLSWLNFESTEIIEELHNNPPLNAKVDFSINSQIIISVNKIIIEFLAINKVDLSLIQDLISKVYSLDTTLNNIIFCNFQHEVRKPAENEISHLVLIRSENKNLFAYFELFNILCGYVLLSSDYKGTSINNYYYQDAITGEKLNTAININIDGIVENESNNFNNLINNLFDRHRNRIFSSILKEQLNLIIEELKSSAIGDDEFMQQYTRRSAEVVAYLTVYDFPYMVKDFSDEKNSLVNYIHSNINETSYDKFCESNDDWIGKQITFPSEGVYIFDSFFKSSLLPINGVKLVKVYCVLIHSELGHKKYIPYHDFFEGLNFPVTKEWKKVNNDEKH